MVSWGDIIKLSKLRKFPQRDLYSSYSLISVSSTILGNMRKISLTENIYFFPYNSFVFLSDLVRKLKEVQLILNYVSCLKPEKRVCKIQMIYLPLGDKITGRPKIRDSLEHTELLLQN